MPINRAPTPRTPETHGRRQYVKNLPDGSRVQCCALCGRQLSVVQRAQKLVA
jgi:hypothetical protein